MNLILEYLNCYMTMKKNWVLDYFCEDKGVNTIQKDKSVQRSRCCPEGEFFSKTEFCSTLRNEIIGDQSYGIVKRFWKTLRLEKLSDLNDIYNFQGTIILCEIFENRATEMMKKTLYNSRKCTSASSLSGCMHRFISKAIIVLPMQAEIVDLFEQTLTGDFNCVNTRLAFDSIISLPKNSENEPKEN